MSSRSHARAARGWLARGLSVLLLTVSIVLFALMAHSILLRYNQVIELNEEIAEVTELLERERQREAELTRQKELLMKPDYIELLAREQLGLIRADDIPYGWGSVGPDH
ncbi:MAG: septum formation initiator family protein [Bacillota bacterium]